MSSETVAAQGDWQAIYSPQHNAYYFYNSKTMETTWANPLVQQSPETESTDSKFQPEASSSAPTYSVLEEAAISQGIDPSLAYLDPSLAANPAASAAGLLPYQTAAKFNARTGQFTKPDGRDPTHMSEYERARRMSEFYFDVSAWEQQRALEEQQEAEGGSKKKKRPSKKDLDRFKEQKRLKKIAKTAWLRT